MRRLKLVGVALVLAVGLSACGDDDPPASESAFCEALVSFDKISTPGGPDEDPVEANKTFGAAATTPVKTLIDNAPTDIEPDVARLVAALKQAASGDATGGDAADEAKGPIELWAYDNCGFHTLDVEAQDHSFVGLPKTAKAGRTSIRLKNTGKEFHIVLWLKREAGDNRPAPEAIGAAFANNFQGFIEAGVAGAAPGQTGAATLDLPAGRYTVFCPIDVDGKTDDPHFAHGMAADITVE